MGFVRIFWKNNVQVPYLPKMSISGKIVSSSEIVAELCLENSIETLLIFGGVDPNLIPSIKYMEKSAFESIKSNISYLGRLLNWVRVAHMRISDWGATSFETSNFSSTEPDA